MISAEATAEGGDEFGAVCAFVLALEAANKELAGQVLKLTAERDRLLASYKRLRFELELLKRRIFIAKAERVDTQQLEIEFGEKMAELEVIAGTVGMGKDDAATPETVAGEPTEPGKPDGDGKEKDPKEDGKDHKVKPKGRRNLANAAIPEVLVEITDPLFEALIVAGKAERIGSSDPTFKLAYERGGARRLVITRVTYKTLGCDGAVEIEQTPMPAETFPRLLAAPSMLAHIAHEKHGRGLPLFRIEEQFRLDGAPVDRGTMSRWMEDLGATLGATIIEAARAHAMATAFVIATDATGICVQPIPTRDKKRQPCKKGHFFVLIADRDHVFFEYTERETSAVVSEMFRGFSGYLQADAKSVYDLLFNGCSGSRNESGDDEPAPCEVGCWSHARRKYWEAAIAKDAVGREALARMHRIFELDASFQGKPPVEIKRLRDAHLRPHVEAFFSWAQVEYDKVRNERGTLRTALGYSVRQKDPLSRFLDDGRLVMTNNRSELQLRKIATGRKAWLFCGSDDHAQSAGHILSLIASARLHGLDAEQYLRDIIRVLIHWPKDRYLELAPLFWRQTRERLDPRELAAELGALTVPPPLEMAVQKSPAN